MENKELLGKKSLERFDEDTAMQPFWSGDTVYGETVMFVDRADKKTLLFKPESIISVCSYDHLVEYARGVDYDVDHEGRLILTEGSSIPCITSEVFYGAGEDSLLVANDRNGNPVRTYWGEGEMMTKWQVSVTYTHSEAWKGFRQKNAGKLAAFVKKLENGEDVTVIFFGDSITYGASASYIDEYNPYQLSWPLLAVKKLARKYGYSVQFVDPALGNTAKVPENAKYGDRGVITYINTAVGGWAVADGVENFGRYVDNFAENYGCDLFILAFGMNDAGRGPESEREHIGKLTDGLIVKAPGASVMLVSTMVPNPDAVNGWFGNQTLFEAEFLALAEKYRAEGIPCEVTRMTSVSQAILRRKAFCDYSGNNINHPNDFMVRIYAQSFYEALVGYSES